MSEKTDVQDKLAILKQSYLSHLPTRLAEVEQAANLAAGQAPESVRTSLETVASLAHKLAGSGATFGFPDVSATARAIESKCSSLLEGGSLSGDDAVNGLGDAVGGLKEAIASAVSGGAERQGAELNASLADSRQQSAPQITRNVIVIGSNDDQVTRLRAELAAFDFKVLSTAGDADIDGLELAPSPAGIVYDLDFPDDYNESTPSTLTAIRSLLDRSKVSCPLIVISGNGDVPSRLQALRAKATSFLLKPILSTDLVDSLDVEQIENGGESYRILVVDDDESTATYTKLILNGAGMIVQTETNPMNILDRLEDFSPELILMDLYMPGCNGHELASVVRQQEVFAGIPIVYLSGEVDVDKQLGAMEYGGDDFLTKPIRPSHLISSVRARSQRFRNLRSQMIRDSMTSLLNHTTTQEFLKNEIGRAKREKRQLALASLDIDHFKSVNDTYGHAVGDVVIKSLARLLKQRLRSVDIIGRMGGEEFAAVLVGASIEKAAEILEEIRESFANIVQIGDGREFSVTLSCGVAEFPAFGTQAELLEASDKALYEAKNAGRNRVVVAKP